MVVARKSPAAPAANQRQPKPKPKPKPVPVPVQTQRTPPRRTRWLPVLVVLFLVYALATCPSDSPVCHSLDSPPVHYILQHADPYIAPAKPYAADAANLVRTHLVPPASALVHSYNSHLAPRLHWFFVDQYWNGIIKPIYYKGLHPHLELHSRPYRVYYKRFIVPALNDAAARANATYVRLTPHAQRYVSESRRHAVNAYQWTRPHFVTAYRRLLPHALAFGDNVKLYALVVASKAGDARRRYVDPHVLRIWEKVAEPEQAREPEAESMVFAPEPEAEPTVSAPEPATTHEPAITSKVATTTPDPSKAEPSSNEAVTTPEPSSKVANEPSQVETAAHEPSPSFTTAAHAHDTSASVHATPVPASEHEAESAASIVAASLHASPSSSPSHPPTTNDEIDDFLKEIGLSPSPSSPTHQTQTQTPTQTQTQAQTPTNDARTPSPAERRLLTAQKRAEITARHGKWQAELDALVRAQTHGVRVFLAESRAAAVGRLARWDADADADADAGSNADGDGDVKGHGRGVVRDVEGEAARLVRGIETYLGGVEDKLRRGGYYTHEEREREREREMWMKVVDKVEKRLADKVLDVHRDVHEWFVRVQEREIQEINAMAQQVKILADRAQADLGIDYAWLDDVTYYDWQKYHDLVRTSENFTAHAHKIQAQTEPAGTNALIDALNALEREVGDAVEGFGVVLGRLRRRAEGPDGVFAPRAEGAGAGAGEDGGEGGGEDARGSGSGKEEGEPRVSILPVPVESGEGESGRVGDVLLGRGKEEVEERLEGVSVEGGRDREEL